MFLLLCSIVVACRNFCLGFFSRVCSGLGFLIFKGFCLCFSNDF